MHKSLQVLGTNESNKNVVLLHTYTKKGNNSTDDFSIFKSQGYTCYTQKVMVESASFSFDKC